MKEPGMNYRVIRISIIILIFCISGAESQQTIDFAKSTQLTYSQKDLTTLDEYRLIANNEEQPVNHKIDQVLLLNLTSSNFTVHYSFADQVAKEARTAASGQGIALLLGSLYLFGDRDVAIKGATAALETSAITYTLKKLVGRQRPGKGDGDGHIKGPFSGNDSFPSGHTALAFTIATVYANQKSSSGWNTYPMASTVGWSRIYLKAHWTEDVIAGALIGYLVGSQY
jgi:hypothetical protein